MGISGNILRFACNLVRRGKLSLQPDATRSTTLDRIGSDHRTGAFESRYLRQIITRPGSRDISISRVSVFSMAQHCECP
jgi:hypothetical protein